jgi:hypothetical protein
MFAMYFLGALVGSVGVIAIGTVVGLALEPATIRNRLQLTRALAWLEQTDWRRSRYAQKGGVR